MSHSQLALFGGDPVIPAPLPPYPSIGADERERVQRVMESGVISGFYGSWGPEFMGGKEVRAFEEAWAERFGVPYVVSVNSATSGLYAAMGAVGVTPGDEVIVPPTTMSASAMAPLIYGGIPVFVDIEPETFCLDVAQVAAAITPRTKAILAVNLFGHPAALHALRQLADAHGIYLIEDNAQAILATEQGRYTGTIGHIGVFSLNYHKHIHTGEGGMCVTHDADLARRLQMIRNHAENIIEPLGIADITNLIGFNYRLTELQAAIGLAQLARVDEHIARREALAQALSAGASDLPGLTVPQVRPDCRHVYYVWMLRYDAQVVGVPRERFSEALAAEGFPHATHYIRPLYRLPVFQQRIAFGAYPFSLSDRRYDTVVCPVAEQMYAHEFLLFEPCAYAVDSDQTEQLIEALRKVYALRETLIQPERA